MKVDICNSFGVAKVSLDEVLELLSGPGRSGAAKVISIGVGVLPSADGILQRPLTVLLNEPATSFEHGIYAALRQVTWTQGGVYLLIQRVGGMRARMVQPVSVDVDVVFGAAQSMGKTPRVDAVHHKDGYILGQILRRWAVQPSELCCRSGIPFCAMYAT